MKECDIQKVGQINALLEISPADRDQAWKDSFYDSVIDASFRCQEPQVILGPDSFPYFSLYSPIPHEPFESFCICNLMEYLLSNGLGVVINPGIDGAEWVFSYGDILTHRMFGVFAVDQTSAKKQPFEEVKIEKQEQVLIGQPSEEFLPASAREAIKRHFLARYGKEDLGVFLMSRKDFNPPTQLVFSIFPEDFGGAERFQGVLQEISWFLPRHYPVLAVPREASLRDSFEAL
ncbi:MAG: hypothetical protein E4G99_10455 [Anaerolineales bacterium]|nr:MAG: hypothetical protein E4G99_10455 [Anaerolineales bacterium]